MKSNMERSNEINERENYLIEILSDSLDEKQKKVFKNGSIKLLIIF